MKSFYSNGKILITSEYLVLAGAKAFAIPCKKGQYLKFKNLENKTLSWKSYDHNDTLWFEAIFELPNLDIIKTSEILVAKRLKALLNLANKENPNFLLEGGEVQTFLEFNKNWGLGSSSTLISNIATWAKVNPYQLGKKSFGGSGYDIACSHANGPIIYTKKDLNPLIENVNFSPLFVDQLFFIYLNKKIDTQKAIRNFNHNSISNSTIKKINTITDKIIASDTLDKFEYNLNQHEIILSRILQKKTVKEKFFSDFKGCIKSLGAWGGDFILATGDKSTKKYFLDKGFKTIIPFNQICRLEHKP